MYTLLHSITILTTLKMYTSDYHTAGTAQDSSLSEQETVFQDRTGTCIHYCTILQYLQHTLIYTSGYHSVDTTKDPSLSGQETVIQQRSGTSCTCKEYCTLLQYLHCTTHLKCTH